VGSRWIIGKLGEPPYLGHGDLEMTMDRDDAVLLHEPDLMLAVLRVAAARAGTLDACIDHLRELRDCAEVEHRVPEAEVRAELEAITAKLGRANLIEWPVASRFRITARGRQVLAEHPSGIDDSVLMRLEMPAAAIQDEAPSFEMPPSAASKESAYDAGYEAYGEGLSLADNPHPPDARAHLDWQNGWSEACDQAQRRRPG
jgi:restriction system protein